MRSYIIKRLLLMIPTMIGITVITFGLIHLAPGDPTLIKAGEGGLRAGATSKKSFEIMRKQFHLDQPIHKQYLLWAKDVVTLNFGISIKDRRPVLDKIVERLPVTIQLNLISIFLVYIIAIPIGVYCSVRQDTLRDRLITIGLFILYSLPSFWVASILIMLFGGGEFWDVFPIHGLTPDNADRLPYLTYLWQKALHYVLPVFCLTFGGLALVSRYARVGMLEVIRQDYIRTARAKGLDEKVVVFKHAFRNALIPLITLFGFLLPSIFGGSIIIETIFSVPGMGHLAYEAVLGRDYTVVMAITTISAMLTLVGILLSDILYAVVDPRISYE